MSEEPTVPRDKDELDTTDRGAGGSVALLERGTTVGRYVVLGHLGSGRTGAVFAAYDPELARRVALELLHRTGEDDRLAQQQLAREVQAIARLRHPNVVAVLDVGVVDGRVFLAMEFIEGTTLTRWLQRDHPLAAVLEVLRAAGAGLAAAHHAGLVHGDFKPDNVLVGGDGTVVVTHLGLARAVAAVSAKVAPLGTPAYIAPEQLGGAAPSPATDQFSFCVALHEAVYGVDPFQAERAATLAGDRIVAPPANRRVPAWVRRAILRGLAVDPSARWPSMDALLERLERHLAGRRRHIAALVGAAGVAGTLGVLAVSSSERMQQLAPDEPHPRSEAEGSDRFAATHALVRLGELAVADASYVRAVELGSRALALCEASGAPPFVTAKAELVLAQARWEIGEHARAVRHAEAARARLRGAGVGSELAAAIEAWLATHVP